jgi:hypothetical protein
LPDTEFYPSLPYALKVSARPVPTPSFLGRSAARFDWERLSTR